MDDISNKTLAVLVIIAIIVSLVGLYLGRIRLVTVGEAATETGAVLADVLSNVDLRIEQPIDFGSVDIDSTSDSTTLPTPQYIKVASIGNTPANIGYYAATALFTILDAGGPNGGVPDTAYQIRWISGVTSGIGFSTPPLDAISDCASYSKTLDIGPYENVVIGSGSEQNIATNCVGSGVDKEGFLLGIQIHVPVGEPSGSKSSTLWFIGTEYT